MDRRGWHLVAAILVSLALTCDAQYVYATVEQGNLRGSTEQTVLGTTYRRFLGIPFAEPPIGELRFVRSRPPAAWEGTRDALVEGSVCLQAIAGSEDCLYLNVFVPEAALSAANATGQLLPVLAWIPGGAFAHGGAMQAAFGPDFFMDQGIIVVTINYRLQALGFLSLEDEVVPGNAGLKDQQMALQWVQRNIAAFGGDPTKVTIGGESAGGCSTSHHFISPKSAGLFRAVIMQNGQSVGPWGLSPTPRDFAFRLGRLLGLETNDSQELVAYLRTQDASLFIDRTSELLTEEEQKRLTLNPFGPVLEPDVEDAIIPEHPVTVLKEGRFNHMPVLTGVTSGEGSSAATDGGIMTDPAKLQALNEDFEAAVAPMLHLPTEEERVEASKKLHDFYFGPGDVTVEDAQAMVDMMTDISFAEPTDSMVRYVSQLSDEPVYYYEFDYRGTSIGNTTFGTPHASEVKFLFLNVRSGKDVQYDRETVEGALRQRMAQSWGNFVKYGNPNGGSDSVVWEPFSVTSPNYLHITTDYELSQNKDKERMAFWHENIPM